jgi:hypothetical protein
MAKERIEVLVDPKTGKISVYVDGLPHKECMARARMLSKGSSLIPLENEIKKKPVKSTPKRSQTKGREKVER